MGPGENVSGSKRTVVRTMRKTERNKGEHPFVLLRFLCKLRRLGAKTFTIRRKCTAAAGKLQKLLAKLKKTSKIERRRVIPVKAANYREEMNKMITE